MPTKPGTYTLAPVAFTYFDPKTGTYQTLTTPRTTVTVTVPNAPKFNVTPPADETTPAAVTAGKAPQAPTPPALPAAIPRDPLSGSEPVATPFARLRTLGLAAAAPFVALGIFWLILATGRARQTDPAAPRRAARQRLAATLARLRKTDATDRPRLLLAWQHDAAALWPLSSLWWARKLAM